MIPVVDVYTFGRMSGESDSDAMEIEPLKWSHDEKQLLDDCMGGTDPAVQEMARVLLDGEARGEFDENTLDACIRNMRNVVRFDELLQTAEATVRACLRPTGDAASDEANSPAAGAFQSGATQQLLALFEEMTRLVEATPALLHCSRKQAAYTAIQAAAQVVAM